MNKHMLRFFGLSALLCTACHASFQTPPHFATLARRAPYEQRATSSEGVVISVRKVALEESADLSFWSDAIAQRLGKSEGYALLSARDVRAQGGEPGKLMCFGRDQNGHTFDYWVAIFPRKKQLFLLEAGGRRDRFEKSRAEVERALASVRIP